MPEVEEGKCDFCGRCQEVCAYNAIVVIKDNVLTFPELCHGCGGCALFCPPKAITEKKRETGRIETGRAGKVTFVQGKLNIGEAMPTPVIRAIKNRLDRSKTVIIDAPPGTSCPMIESIKKSDFCLLVTEPTPFGLNDLELAVGVARRLNLPVGVVINRAGAGDDKVRDYCGREEIPLLMEIPLSRRFAKAYSEGKTLVAADNGLRKKFRELFERIVDIRDRS